MAAGEIVLFDKAYVDFAHLYALDVRGVFWVTRPKESMAYRVVKKRQTTRQGRILRDEEIVLTVFRTHGKYPQRLRRVEAEVEIDGQWRVMIFITNNLEWAASSVAELYRCRWQIEVFFKQIKQTLQLSDFLGNSANAVRWQVWTALLCYVLLRFLSHLSRWGSSFIRLWAVVRSSLWQHLDLRRLLASYGTAGGSYRYLARPEVLWLPGLQPLPMG
jgi:IS4 transposase